MAINTQQFPEIQAVIDIWQPYIESIEDWQALVEGDWLRTRL